MNQQENREKGMLLLAEGTPPAEVAERMGVTVVTAYRWRNRSSAQRSIPSTTASGRRPLDTADIAKLGDVINNNKPGKFGWSVYTRSGFFNLANVRALVQSEFPDSHEATLSATGLLSWLKRNGFGFHERWRTMDQLVQRLEQQALLRAALAGDTNALAKLPSYLQEGIALGARIRGQ